MNNRCGRLSVACCLVSWWLGAAPLVAGEVTSATPGVTRTYYVAADEVAWDYAPGQMDHSMGDAFDTRAQVFLERGEDRLGTFHSSNFGRRRFCRTCGTQLTIQLDHQPETIDFPIGSLDDPDAVVPAFHIFYASKVAWFETADDLPRHDRFRPGTRGLEGTEPPGG